MSNCIPRGVGHRPHGRKEEPRKKEEIRKGSPVEVACKFSFEEWLRFRQEETQPRGVRQQSEGLTAAVTLRKIFFKGCFY